MKPILSASEVREQIREKLSQYFGMSPAEAGDEYFYKACVLIVKDILVKNRKAFTEKAAAQKTKQVYYLCMEFLMGRSLKNNLSNLGLLPAFQQALLDYGVKLERIF